MFSLVAFQDELRVVAEAVGEEGDREAVEPHRASVAPEHAVELQDREIDRGDGRGGARKVKKKKKI